MPHKPRPNEYGGKKYVRLDGELIHLHGKARFFHPGEVVESPRHLSPSYGGWVLAQHAYEYYRKKRAENKPPPF